MKNSTSIAANWEERDAQMTKRKVLIIANSRGKKPVLRDIKKAYDILNGLLTELNPSEGKTALKECDKILWDILHDNF